MNKFQELVTHVRNLHDQGIESATFDVAYLHTVLGTAAPTAQQLKAQRKSSNPQIIGDGGSFSDE